MRYIALEFLLMFCNLSNTSLELFIIQKQFTPVCLYNYAITVLFKMGNYGFKARCKQSRELFSGTSINFEAAMNLVPYGV